MNELEKIEGKIKELYGKKETFCNERKYSFKGFGSKLRTVQSHIDWLNDFLSPLKLQVEIVTKREKPTHKILQYDNIKFEGTYEECVDVKKRLEEDFGNHDLEIVPV